MAKNNHIKFTLSCWKAIFLSFLLILSIYLIGKLTIWTHYTLFFTIIAYLIFILFGFHFNFKKITVGFWRFDGHYLFICIVGTIGIFLINISLPTTIYLLFEKDLMVQRKISSLDIITALTIYPIIEEVFYRKCVARGLYNLYGFKKALWVSSTVFAVSHIFSGNGILIVFMIGLFLGYIYLITNSILLSILTHSFSNFLVLFAVPLMQKGTINYIKEENFIYIGFIVILIGIALLIIFYKKIKFEKGKKETE